MQSPYKICFPVGCMADYPATDDMIGKMKKGQAITVQAINLQGTPISLPLPLSDFAKAYDGPPTDPKVFEEQQRKLQEELQKKAEEARKKLEEPAGQGRRLAGPPGEEVTDRSNASARRNMRKARRGRAAPSCIRSNARIAPSCAACCAALSGIAWLLRGR